MKNSESFKILKLDIYIDDMRQDALYSKEMTWWYDKIYVPEKVTKKQIKFLDTIFKRYKIKKVLDIACGAGRHAIPLRKLGYKIVGVDLSKDMLRIAKEKARNEELKMPFRLMDMRNIKLKEKFDAAIIMFSSFMYNITNEDVIKTMNSVNKILKKKGILIIDFMFVWSYIVNKKLNYKFKETMKRRNLKMLIDNKHKLDSSNLIMITKSTYKRFKNKKPLKKVVIKRALRSFTPNEFDLLFRLTGFKTLNFYGNFNIKSKLSKKKFNKRLIAVGMKI